MVREFRFQRILNDYFFYRDNLCAKTTSSLTNFVFFLKIEAPQLAQPARYVYERLLSDRMYYYYTSLLAMDGLIQKIDQIYGRSAIYHRGYTWGIQSFTQHTFNNCIT